MSGSHTLQGFWVHQMSTYLAYKAVSALCSPQYYSHEAKQDARGFSTKMHENDQLIYPHSAAMWYQHNQVEFMNPLEEPVKGMLA